MQAGKEGGAGGSTSIEQLLEAASKGRSKYDPLASDIDRLRAGGVTLRAIADWVTAQGIKSEVGELGQWLKRRKARQARLKEHQALLTQGEGQAGKEEGVGPTAAPTRQAAARPAKSPTPTAPVEAVEPWERMNQSKAEKELDERIAAARKNAPGKRRVFGKRDKE